MAGGSVGLGGEMRQAAVRGGRRGAGVSCLVSAQKRRPLFPGLSANALPARP